MLRTFYVQRDDLYFMPYFTAPPLALITHPSARLYHRAHFLPPAGSQPVRQPFPPVNPERLISSSVKAQSMLADAQLILNKIQQSKSFSTQLKDLAQRSEQAKVDQLIQSIGIKSTVKTRFTPDQIKFELRRSLQENDCCHLSVALKW